MEKNKVIERLCILASAVGTEVFLDQKAHDCFCAISSAFPSFRFEDEVLEFIENAVMEKVNESKIHRVDSAKHT